MKHLTPEERRRNCETCGKLFVPRMVQLRIGQGRFCSQKCNTAIRAASVTPEALAKRSATRRHMEAEGRVKRYYGADNPRWKGGPELHVRRYIESGKANAQLRRYRAANPHKTREWAQNRKYRKHGRLPYGTIPKLGDRQKWKCAICRTNVKDSYHVDHIMPIAKGGRHEPRNLQLLCATCNVRKNAKDPIAYMQELGRLL